VLAETGVRFIRLEIFETASSIASGYTFSLAIPVLASIYRDLNGITNAVKPSYSWLFYPTNTFMDGLLTTLILIMYYSPSLQVLWHCTILAPKWHLATLVMP